MTIPRRRLRVLQRAAADDSRIGGVDYAGTGVAVSATWGFNKSVHPVSPATAVAWTVSEIDGAEIGAKVTT